MVLAALAVWVERDIVVLSRDEPWRTTTYLKQLGKKFALLSTQVERPVYTGMGFLHLGSVSDVRPQLPDVAFMPHTIVIVYGGNHFWHTVPLAGRGSTHDNVDIWKLDSR